MKRKLTFLITAALMLLTMIVSPGRAVGQTRSTTYEAATSIAVNDVVLLVAESSTYKKELSGFTTSGTIYGTVTDYTSIPNGVYPLTVVAGNSEGSFAFKNSDDKYLSWSSGNSLQLSATLNDNSSWTFNYAYTVTTITNVGTTTRQIKYNSSSPRFACYTSGQQSIKLYKQVSSSLTDSDLALNNAPVALEFDLYNNYDDQTVSYTTSSTGLVAIDDNQYIDTEIDQNNKTITVTPKKVTPSTQTITVNQAADATYAAGSTTFTISIANSAPYTQPTEIEANLNNSLFGTNYSGSASNITDNNPLIGIVDNVTVTYAGSGNHYVNNSQIRFYPNNKLTFEAPSGYEIKQIVFTSAGTWAATISADGGTYNSSTKTWTGSASSVLFTGSGSSRCDMSKADITIGAASSLPTPTITIDAAGITNTNVFEGIDAGSLSASVTYNEVAVEGATVTWSGNNDEVATINTTSGAVTLVAAGSVTFTATFAGNENYNSATAPYVMTVTNDDPNAPGTENNPYTVAQAIAAIDDQGTINEAYATGIVCQVDSYNSTYHSITYWISDDGTTTTKLQVYSGKGIDGANFSSKDDIEVGATVVVKGKLKKYNTTYEFDLNNQLVTYVAPVVDVQAPTITPASCGLETSMDVTITPAAGTTIYYTTDGSDPDNSGTGYTTMQVVNVSETTTIKAIAYIGEQHSNVVSAVYTKITNIENITAVGTTYFVKGTVVATNSKGYIIGDGTNYIYVYLNAAPTVALNDKVYVYGTTGTYGQIIQFTNSATVTEATTSNYNNTPAATVITEVPNYSEGYHLSTYFEFEGALTKSDNYYINVGGTDIQISYPTTAQGTALTALNGKTVHVKGYFSGINSSSKFTVMLESAEEVAVPAITLAQYEYNLNADGGNAELPVTYTNMPATPQAEVIFYEANGTTTATYDWITAEINSNNNIAGHIDVNEGEARSAYFKVKGIDANDNAVYSDLVTINQAAPAAPSIVFETASMNLIAGGESDRKLSFDYSGLGNAPTFTIYYYEQDGETQVTAETYEWLTATIDENNKLNITVVANEGEARSAYLKVYGEKNENVHAESNLVTITQAEYVVDYATLPFEFDGGRADIANTNGLTQDGLDSDYGSSPKLKFNGTGDWVILKINETPGVLSFDIKGNSFSGSTFTVQTSEDGITYTDLETYTELGDTQNESFDNLGENVRYIKWIYTEKSNGNVGLGNIGLTKYVAPVASITVTPASVNVTAEGEDDGSLAIVYANLTITQNDDFDIQFYDANNQPLDKADEPDWMIASVQATTTQDVYEVSYAIDPNDGDARTAYFKVYAMDDNSELVYSNLVTVSQEAYLAPTATIAVTPETVNVEASGEDEGSLVIAYENLTITDAGDFDIQYYDANNQPLEKEQEPDWMAAAVQANTTQDGYEVSYYIDPNEGAARTAYFKVYALDGNTEIVYSNLVTINQAAYVVDYATLPFEWEGGPRSEFEALTGTSTYSVGDYTSETVYCMKLDATGDYIQIKTNEQPGIVTIGVKMVGGASTSHIIVKGSSDGDNFTDVEDLTISGVQNSTHTLETTNDFAATDRYVRLYFNKGSNVGVGPITIAQVDHTPSITAADVEITYDATGGSIAYTINNVVSGGTLTASTESDWLTLSTEFASPIQFTCNANEATSARTATVTLTYIYNAKETVTKNVTVTQAAAPAPTFTVSFAVGDGGTFVPNTDFPTVEESKPAGTYTLPSATKEGYTFTGWNDGTTTYAGGAEYTVSADVTFTAQWTEIPAGSTYTLVTDANDIVSGKHYIIVGFDDTDAYGIGEQATNNRSGVPVTITSNQITTVGNAKELVINGPTDGKYTIYDAAEPGYLYAASSSKNYLKTQTALDDNGRWTISVTSEGAATITAQGSNSRKLMRFNPNNGSPLFACYATSTTTGSLPYIYVKDDDHNREYYGCEITIDALNGNSVVVGNGSVITFTGTNTNAADLIIEDGGQLIHTNNLAATLQKNITAWTTKDVGGWYFIASPVNGAAIDESFDQTAIDLFKYDEPDAYWYSYLDNGHNLHPFSTLTRGVGYLHASESQQTLNFAGMMVGTNDNISLDLSYACTYADVKGFNLVGNPFTRNLTTGDITKGGVELTTYYGINAATTGMEAKLIANEPIKPGQGFFVQVESTDENHKLVFNPSKKDETVDNGYICIAAENENNMDKAYVQIQNGNTLRKMNIANMMEVYVMNDGDDYAAARVEELAGTMPVHFKAVEDGEFTITINAKNIEASTMMLFDNQTGELIDLLETPTYAFKASAEDDDNRFKLIFDFNNNYNGVDDNYVNGNFAYQNGDELFVSGDGTLQVFDVMGRFVMSKEIHGSESVSVSAFETGVYMLRFVGENIMTQKIVVR